MPSRRPPTCEVLGLDAEEPNPRNRWARVRRNGGAVDVTVWRIDTARLLPGPVDHNAAINIGRRAVSHAADDAA